MTMSFEEFRMRIVHPSVKQRRGQYAANLLFMHRNDLSNRINGTEIDPFYDDSRIEAFLAWCKENW